METTQPDRSGASADPGVAAEIARLGHQLGRHARLLHMMKAQLTDVMPPGVDWATFGVLAQLSKCGATRQADLAEISLLDPSTVSRYVGQLVRQGLVERRPDQRDGRAVQLVATDRGRAIVEDTVQRHNQAFLAALHDWQEADLHALTDLLTRFNDDLEAFRQGATRTGSAGPPSTSSPPDPTH